MPPASRRALLRIYERLRAHFGPQGWWPGESTLEVCLGAILTQNTAWTNVERALGNLRASSRLDFAALRDTSDGELAALLRPAGTFNVKARRVRAFLDFVTRELDGDVERMRTLAPDGLRRRLLAVEGIGPETADAMILYAGGHPVFVVDAYTRRIGARLGWLGGREGYHEIQAVFMGALPRDAALFNDYHAQLVALAKATCRPRPLCADCALRRLCRTGRMGASAGRGRGHGGRL